MINMLWLSRIKKPVIFKLSKSLSFENHMGFLISKGFNVLDGCLIFWELFTLTRAFKVRAQARSSSTFNVCLFIKIHAQLSLNDRFLVVANSSFFFLNSFLLKTSEAAAWALVVWSVCVSGYTSNTHTHAHALREREREGVRGRKEIN